MRNLSTWLMGLVLAGMIYLIMSQNSFAQEAPEEQVEMDQDVTMLASSGTSSAPNSAVGGGIQGSSKGDAPEETEELAEESSTGTSEAQTGGFFSGIGLNYFGIVHGPSIGNPSVFQPFPDGTLDKERPILTQNYLNLNKNLSENVNVTAQGYWLWQPVLNQYVELMDPSLRVSHSRVLGGDNHSLYSDLRVHFGVSGRSREQDQIFGMQTFHVLNYTVPNSRLSVGAFGSLRYNFFGNQGYGRKVELYGAPNLAYQISQRLAFTMLYEMSASNWLGDPVNVFFADGSDLEPGLRWDVTDELTLSPYVNIMVNDRVTLDSTSVGMMVNWIVL